MVARYVVPGIRADCHPSMEPHTSSPSRLQQHSPVCCPAPASAWSWTLHSLSKFASAAENYPFVFCGVSELNYSLHVTQRVPELVRGAGLGGRALPAFGSTEPSHQLGPRQQTQLQSSLNPSDLWCLILSLQQASGLSPTHFRCSKKKPHQCKNTQPTSLLLLIQSPNQLGMPKSKALLSTKAAVRRMGPCGQDQGNQPLRRLHLQQGIPSLTM